MLYTRHDTCKNFWSIIGRTGWENSKPWSLAEREIWPSPHTARSAQTQESPLLTRHAVRKHRKSVPHFDTALPQFKSEKASNVMPGIDK